VEQDRQIFDFDTHYYEAEDAFTRHQDRSLGSRGVRWADIDGRRRLIVGGRVNNYIANPTFDPVSRPGALYSWYRGNPERKSIREAFGKLEPLRPEYRDREARLRILDEQGVRAALLFPTLGVGLEEALKDDPGACAKVFHGFNRWLAEEWGFCYRDRMYAVPYVPLLDPVAAAAELRAVIERDAIVVNIRNAPVPVPGGYRSPFDREYDAFWGLAEEAGIVVATHAGLDGYDTIVRMWEPGAAESSVLRTPLRGVLTKGRAVTDFYGAALCQLLFERFPRLRLASVENGGGWIADLLHRLDDAANRNPGYFRDHPRLVFGEHVWVTPFWEDQIGDLLADVRLDRLLLGSDWPHAEGVAQPSDFITESLATLDDHAVRRICHDNAAEVLGLPAG
jgi:predicted TIM-barrel fold metal-dependent hydrolase